MKPSEDEKRAYKLAIRNRDRERCVVCHKPSIIVHEIVPRSRQLDWWKHPENGVILCPQHHAQVHHEGTKAWEERLILLSSGLISSR